MKAVQVKLQNCTVQAGIERVPVIKWEYTQRDSGNQQKAYRIVISDGEKTVYDSGVEYSSRQNGIEAEFPLKTHVKYEIVIEITDNNGCKEKSDKAYFISGVCGQSEWRGKWISNLTKKPFFTGTMFDIGKEVSAAYLSVCGLGQYEAVINAKKAGSSVLDGSWTDFNKHVHYQTYDITDHLCNGENNICIEVGNGWYIADTSEERHFYTLNHRYQPYGKYLTCIAQITIYFADGTRQNVFTDGHWWTAPSPTLLANVYGSEDYDAGQWKGYGELYHRTAKDRAVELKEENCPKGHLTPMLYPPVIVKKIYETRKIMQQGEHCFVFDLGQNMSGQFEIHVKGKKGQKIKITPVEKMSVEGKCEKTTETWCSYILSGSGKTEIWRPKFSYSAGRWVMVEGVTRDENNDKLPCILDVKGYFVTSAAEDTGKFTCSDKRYEQIHGLVKMAVESNLNHIHTDCPSIEKLGWLEPNHLMGPSIMYLKNVDTLWEKISADMRAAQYEDGERDWDTGCFPHEYSAGLIPSIAPRYAKFITDFGEGSFWDIIPWGSSILLAADFQNQFYGNCRVIRENYAAAKKYVDYQYQKYQNYPFIYGHSGKEHFICHGLGDWGIQQNKGESRENLETAFLFKDLCLLSEFSYQNGDSKAGLEYQMKASEVKAAYNEALLKYDEATGQWLYDAYDCTEKKKTQANQAIPLYFGMVPEDKRTSVEKSLLQVTKEGRFSSGEIGLRFIFRTLAGLGKNDLIQDMIMQEEHPSYYRFVRQGETTLPEFWRDDARSRNHDMMGQIVEWFYSEVAGITSKDGFSNIRIAPRLVEGLNWINCEYQAITGKIQVRCEKNADTCYMAVTVPVNTNAVIHLPNLYDHMVYTCSHPDVQIQNGVCQVPGGVYEFWYHN
ncbi:family 78 glycoside hydrolase catalytic domain [uncultured Robinsoniella sp.]|uniref:family 78 glycoside hydrolase catalytic domain n=1 Tax=uncultured Robinsoniella sp. TaxID=904190 RepID=UPI00374F2F79